MPQPRKTLNERTAILEAGQDRIVTALNGLTHEFRDMKTRVDVLNGHKPKLESLLDVVERLEPLAGAAPMLVEKTQQWADEQAAARVRARRWGWIGHLDVARPWLYVITAFTAAGLEHLFATKHWLGF